MGHAVRTALSRRRTLLVLVGRCVRVRSDWRARACTMTCHSHRWLMLWRTHTLHLRRNHLGHSVVEVLGWRNMLDLLWRLRAMGLGRCMCVWNIVNTILMHGVCHVRRITHRGPGIFGRGRVLTARSARWGRCASDEFSVVLALSFGGGNVFTVRFLLLIWSYY